MEGENRMNVIGRSFEELTAEEMSEVNGNGLEFTPLLTPSSLLCIGGGVVSASVVSIVTAVFG